tara:strand:+ start:35730 stop:39422 length:3693 start_codon:yes stop_codon:yes gene_type:complete
VAVHPTLAKIIKRCQQDPEFFINNFCKVKHPKLGIIKFKLFGYQKKCLKDFTTHRFNIFRKCLAEGSPVWTPKGPINIENIKIGDLVYTYNEQSGTVETAPVLSTLENGMKDTFEVRTKTGHKSYATADHEYLTRRGWVEVGDLTQNDVLVEIYDSEIGTFGKEPKCQDTTKKGFFFNREKGQVLSIKPHKKVKTYDLEVPPHSNFIVDGSVVHNCRQVGISTLSGAFALWYAMFFNNKTVLIVSRTDPDAKNYLDRNIKFVYKHLPKWMKDLWKPDVMNEHSLGFQNGSMIRSLTSNPDTLRSNASSLNIIDEAAFIQHMDDMWKGGFSCIRPDSLISSEGSLVEIGSLGDLNGGQWQDIDVEVQSDFCIKNSDKFYINGIASTNIITTKLGYEIECTGNHRLKDDQYEWVYSKDVDLSQKLSLKCGSDFDVEFDTYINNVDQFPTLFIEAKNADTVSPICFNCSKTVSVNYRTYKRNFKRNSNKFICFDCAPVLKMGKGFNKPKILDERLAELIGYYVGDGCIVNKRPHRFLLSYDPQDSDVSGHFGSYFNSIGLDHSDRISNGAGEFRVNSSPFVKWFEKHFHCKTHAHNATIPEMIMKSSQKIHKAFLRGLFEADGWCYQYDDKYRPNSIIYSIGFSSISEKLARLVQVMLLNLGIISRKTIKKGGFENSKESYRLEILNLDNRIKFMSDIGFISERKKCDIVRVASRRDPIKYVVKDGIFIDEVVSVVKSKSFTVDISVPGNNTYVANGFVSHNTMQTGGSCIVISTPKGVGNWYYKTWSAAVDKENNFNPILINWWNMDWSLDFVDELSGNKTVISPTREMKKLEKKEDIEKYGPYWSPWLETQYDDLSTKGDDSAFRQEVLAEFLGSGHTVLNRNALFELERMVAEYGDKYKVLDSVEYINPSQDVRTVLDFQEQFWIWDEPFTQADADREMAKARRDGTLDSLPEHAKRAHLYIVGADPSTGEADDYSTLEIFDVDTQEQVAELRMRVLPKMFARMADYVGRLYNNALIVPERTGIGATLCQELEYELMYPTLYRHKTQTTNLKMKYNKTGFPTSNTTKHILVKCLKDNVGIDGWTIKSPRLYRELCIFIHLGGGRYGNEPGTGNTDDLVLAACFALIGIPEAILTQGYNLAPLHNMDISSRMLEPVIHPDKHRALLIKGGRDALAPVNLSSEGWVGKVDATSEVARFASQLGSHPLGKNTSSGKPNDSVSFKKHVLKYFKR